jgi:hypothetical protein
MKMLTMKKDHDVATTSAMATNNSSCIQQTKSSGFSAEWSKVDFAAYEPIGMRFCL